MDLHTKHCPRCDRGFSSAKSAEAAMLKLRQHIADNHPDYDPDWEEAD